MRHGAAYRKLGRTSAHRTAMFANMAASLIKHEQITTTLPKAKELRPFVEKLVTLAKKGDLHARRQAISQVRDVPQVGKLFETIGPRYADRNGGYIRIMKAGYRHGDNAAMAVIEFVDRDTAAKGLDSGPVYAIEGDEKRKRSTSGLENNGAAGANRPPFLLRNRIRPKGSDHNGPSGTSAGREASRPGTLPPGWDSVVLLESNGQASAAGPAGVGPSLPSSRGAGPGAHHVHAAEIDLAVAEADDFNARQPVSGPFSLVQAVVPRPQRVSRPAPSIRSCRAHRPRSPNRESSLDWPACRKGHGVAHAPGGQGPTGPVQRPACHGPVILERVCVQQGDGEGRRCPPVDIFSPGIAVLPPNVPIDGALPGLGCAGDGQQGNDDVIPGRTVRLAQELSPCGTADGGLTGDACQAIGPPADLQPGRSESSPARRP